MLLMFRIWFWIMIGTFPDWGTSFGDNLNYFASYLGSIDFNANNH